MNGALSMLSDRLGWLGQEFFGNSEVSGWVPSLDIREDADRFTVDVEVPGVKREEIDVTFSDGELRIRGERKWEKSDGVTWHRQERGVGVFTRTVQFPVPVKSDAIEASFRDGILTVSVPKAEEAKPRKVQIKVSDP